MPANFDVYQVNDIQDFFGQTCMNIYFYQRNAPTGTDLNAEGLAGTFIAEVIPAITLIQADALTHVNVQVKNLFDPSDTWEQAISVPGDGTSTDLFAAFNAVGFTLNHNNGALRPGAKRYAGLVEEAATDGVIDDAGIITSLNALADALVLRLDQGLEPTAWWPVIVQRLLVGGEYVLPTSLEDAVLGFLTDAIFKALVTSQVSRKIGVGQ